jgi:hypothetical protein
VESFRCYGLNQVHSKTKFSASLPGHFVSNFRDPRFAAAELQRERIDLCLFPTDTILFPSWLTLVVYRSLGGLVSYEISQSEIPTCPLWRVGNEQMLVEKLSSFVVHGRHNTRAKDLFDAAWIMTNLKINRQKFRLAFGHILKELGLFEPPEKVVKRLVQLFGQKDFIKKLALSYSGWEPYGPQESAEIVAAFLKEVFPL